MPVWASRAGAGQNAGAPDHFFDDVDSLLGGLRAVQIAKSFAGEAAFMLDAADGERALFIGDAIERYRATTGRCRCKCTGTRRERYSEIDSAAS